MAHQPSWIFKHCEGFESALKSNQIVSLCADACYEKLLMMFTTYTEDDIQSRETKPENLSETPESELVEKYDLEKCCGWIKRNDYKTTCLQFPGHLLSDGTSIALYLQNSLGRPVYVLADTSYGSCCVDEVAAQHVDADSIIHFGHACLSPVTKLPVLYVFEKEKLDVRGLYESCQGLEEDVIIFYDDVYHHLHSDLCNVFKEKQNISVSQLCFNAEDKEGRGVICGRMYTKPSERNVSAVYVGDESVTLQNLILALPDYKWYRYTKEGKLEKHNLNRNRFLMQRSHLAEKIRNSNVLGILIGTLGIKNYLDAVNHIKLLAKQKGKKCYILAVGKPNVAKLANFPEIDVFVLISCEENSLLKDFKEYYKPVVSLFEVEMALGDRPYGIEYTSDFRQLLPGGSFHIEIEPVSQLPSVNDSQEIMEKDPGTLIEHAGANFLANRSWRGLEQNKTEMEVCKAVKGRSGIPQAYENELETLSEEKS